MLRLALPFVLVLSALAAPATSADSQYNDPEGRFSVTIPEGWKPVETSNPAAVALLLGKEAGGERLGACAIVVSVNSFTKSQSQAEINEGLRAVLTKELWENIYKGLGGQDVVVSDFGTREQDGAIVAYAVVEYTIKAGLGATALRVKSREELHALPGVAHDVGCIARVEKFEAIDPEFKTVLASYVARPGMIAQAPSAPPSVMTLYANAGFDGTARVVSQATPNVAALGRSREIGSLAISGFGEWQVCEGANYTGRCMNVVGALAAPARGAIRVGSLRPIEPGRSLRGIASLISSDTARLVRESVGHLGRH